jgi:hypothetical protein
MLPGSKEGIMNKVSHPELLAALERRYGQIELERLELLVFFLQSFDKLFAYSFEVHHFRVRSRELEQDLNSLQQVQAATNDELLDASQEITKYVLKAPLDELELAAALAYFQRKGYEASEIERVLNPDKELLHRANSLLSAIHSRTTAKDLALSGSRQ